MGTDARLADALDACRAEWEPGSAESVAAFADMLRRWPAEPAAVYAAAVAHDDAGRVDAALPLSERALEGLDGTDLRRCFLRLGSGLGLDGRHDEAAAVLQRGLAEFPGSRSLRTFLAVELQELGRHDAALGLVLEVLVDPLPSPDLELFAPEIHRRAAVLAQRDG